MDTPRRLTWSKFLPRLDDAFRDVDDSLVRQPHRWEEAKDLRPGDEIRLPGYARILLDAVAWGIGSQKGRILLVVNQTEDGADIFPVPPERELIVFTRPRPQRLSEANDPGS
jgi:hypothetical protein